MRPADELPANFNFDFKRRQHVFKPETRREGDVRRFDETSCLPRRAASEMLAESKQSRTGNELVGLVLRDSRVKGCVGVVPIDPKFSIRDVFVSPVAVTQKGAGSRKSDRKQHLRGSKPLKCPDTLRLIMVNMTEVGC